jgi:hypothetical protein
MQKKAIAADSSLQGSAHKDNERLRGIITLLSDIRDDARS